MSYRVEFDHNTAFIYGDKAEARRRIAACGDWSPIWVQRREAWATSPTVANRVLDQIEGRLPVAIEDVDQLGMEFVETVPANHIEIQGSLW